MAEKKIIAVVGATERRRRSRSRNPEYPSSEFRVRLQRHQFGQRGQDGRATCPAMWMNKVCGRPSRVLTGLLCAFWAHFPDKEVASARNMARQSIPA
jgi:hypothetical protein